MKYYYTYKITCTEGHLKGKIYFGKHVSKRKVDKYKGSGKILKDYYKKYPNGYIKEIICYYNDHDELKAAEIELIKQHLGKDYCINILPGGEGFADGHTPWNKGKTGYNLPKKTKEQREKISEAIKIKSKDAEYTKRKSDGLRGKKRTDEQILNISISHIGQNKGTHWYTNGKENIRCFECPDGFHAGITTKN